VVPANLVNQLEPEAIRSLGGSRVTVGIRSGVVVAAVIAGHVFATDQDTVKEFVSLWLQTVSDRPVSRWQAIVLRFGAGIALRVVRVALRFLRK
jgi:hypothetical protein